MEEKKIRHFDAFAWVWGFSLALRNSVWGKNIETVGFADIVAEFTRCKKKYTPKILLSDTKCQCELCWKVTDIPQAVVYKKRFWDVPNFWDISKIKIENMPDFDLLTGGVSRRFSRLKTRSTS